jgi:succinate-semialdehyde dehydrogenase/glutarate-semialdehyde dehydrogenase
LSKYAVINPATGELGKQYPQISDADMLAAIDSAHNVYRTWSKSTTIAERAALMENVAGLHRTKRQHLAEIIVREMGKPIAQALGEVDFTADIYSFYATNAERFLADEPIVEFAGEGEAFIRRSALGVLIGIMPWNFPYYQVARFAGPNLILGNTILLKHAAQCPESAEAMHNIFAEAGFPVGAYTNVYADSKQIADAIADPRVQGVSLTGSERAGAAVAEVAGRNLKKVVLELGGNDPFILLSTDDMNYAVDAAIAARNDNNGQACNAGKRFIIIENLYEEFLEKFTAKTTSLKVEDAMNEDTYLSPLSSASAADGLAAQLESAVANGAKVHGSSERNGTHFGGVVLTHVTSSNPAHYEEFFGPVAMVYSVKSEAEAIELANDTPFGLGSYLFSTDKAQVARVADQIEAGMVYVNGVGLDSPELPFGGVKRSGFGRELGRYGIEEFVNRKLIRILK